MDKPIMPRLLNSPCSRAPGISCPPMFRMMMPNPIQIAKIRKTSPRGVRLRMNNFMAQCSLMKKAEPPPTRDVNRDSGTASANGGWLRRLVRLLRHTKSVIKHKPSKGKHSQNDAKKSHERLHEMVNNESDNSVNPRWQENSPNNAENSAQKSCRDNLHADVKK